MKVVNELFSQLTIDSQEVLANDCYWIRFLTGSSDMDKMSDSYFAEFVCMIIPGNLDGFYIELEL